LLICIFYVNGPKVGNFKPATLDRVAPVVYDKLLVILPDLKRNYLRVFSWEEGALNTWELAILKSIDSDGGSANTKHIYESFESGEFIELSEEHLRATSWEGRSAYQHQIRSHLSNLVQAGDLHRIGRGVYQLTEQGRHRID
jgi:hypothetical protein